MGWTRAIELGAMGHALHESGWLLYWRHPLSQANGERGDERRYQVLGVPPSDFSFFLGIWHPWYDRRSGHGVAYSTLGSSNTLCWCGLRAISVMSISRDMIKASLNLTHARQAASTWILVLHSTSFLMLSRPGHFRSLCVY